MTNIKVFLDYSCPFCYIGFEIMDRLRKEDPSITFEYIPYELNSGTPIEGSNLSDRIPKKQIENSYKRIERLGLEYGLIYNNKTKNFNTHRLLLAGLYSIKEDKFYEFSREAFKAIFKEGKNVGLPVIVNEIGLAAGLNIVEMNNCIEQHNLDKEFFNKQEMAFVYEIDSVPTFIVNDKKKVTLLKEYSKFKKDLVE